MNLRLLEYILRGDLVVPYVVRALASTGVLSRVRSGPVSTEELARELCLDPAATDVSLRYLECVGVVVREADRWRLSAPAHRLLSPPRLAALTSNNLSRRIGEAAGAFEATLTGGRPAYEETYGATFWCDLGDNVDYAEQLHADLQVTCELIASGLRRDPSFTSAGSVVDVGGGRGTLVLALAPAMPQATFRIVEDATAARLAEANIADAGLEERVVVDAQDFFAGVPRGSEVYLLSQVLHDWPDDQAVAVLRTIGAAMSSASSLWIIERDPESVSHAEYNRFMSLRMMVIFGAYERTAQQYAALGAEAGLTLLDHADLGNGLMSVKLGRAPTEP